MEPITRSGPLPRCSSACSSEDGSAQLVIKTLHRRPHRVKVRVGVDLQRDIHVRRAGRWPARGAAARPGPGAASPWCAAGRVGGCRGQPARSRRPAKCRLRLRGSIGVPSSRRRRPGRARARPRQPFRARDLLGSAGDRAAPARSPPAEAARHRSPPISCLVPAARQPRAGRSVRRSECPCPGQDPANADRAVPRDAGRAWRRPGRAGTAGVPRRLLTPRYAATSEVSPPFRGHIWARSHGSRSGQECVHGMASRRRTVSPSSFASGFRHGSGSARSCAGLSSATVAGCSGRYRCCSWSLGQPAPKWPPLKVHAWPYCVQCFALHRMYVVSIVVMVLGVVSYVLGLVRFLWIAGTLDDTTMALVAGGGVLALTGAVVSQPFSWRKLARAHVSRDRSSLRVEGHGRFAADVRTRLTEKRAQPQAADRGSFGSQPLNDYRY